MKILHFMQIVCTTEGSAGLILNLTLIYYLIHSKTSGSKIFLVPLYISASVGICLCSLITMMNFTHIFRDGTLVCVLLSPLVEHIPPTLRDLMFQVAFVIMTLMWTLTPLTSLLQLTALTRSYWKPWRRLAVSFLFTLGCFAVVLYTIPLVMPSPALAILMEKSMRELFETDRYLFLQTYGSSITYASINDGKSTLKLLILFVVIPYCGSYVIIVASMIQIHKNLTSNGVALSERTVLMQRQFFVMQLLQSILPLVLLSVPAAIVSYGTIADADLGLATLPLTGFVWLVPIVQASVQLRYVSQASARAAPDASNARAASIMSSKVQIPESKVQIPESKVQRPESKVRVILV